MLDIVGLAEFASQTDEDYVGNAIGLATGSDRQRQVRERMSAGSVALFDAVGVIRALEDLLFKITA